MDFIQMLMTRIVTFKVSFTKEAIRGNMEMLAFYRRRRLTFSLLKKTKIKVMSL